MATTLQEMLLAPDTRPRVIADGMTLIQQEVSAKSGISGTAVKLAYKTVNAFASGYVQSMVETLLPDMIRIAMRAMGIGLPEAVAMASAVPARAAGLDGVGTIAPGHHADLALFTEDLTLKAVALAGHWQHTNALSGKEPSR